MAIYVLSQNSKQRALIASYAQFLASRGRNNRCREKKNRKKCTFFVDGYAWSAYSCRTPPKKAGPASTRPPPNATAARVGGSLAISPYHHHQPTTMKAIYGLQYQLNRGTIVSRHTSLATAAREQHRRMRSARKAGDLQSVEIVRLDGQRLSDDESRELDAIEAERYANT